MTEDRADMWRNVGMDGWKLEMVIVVDGQTQWCFGLVHVVVVTRVKGGWMHGWIVGATSSNNNSACQNGCFHQR